MNRHRGDSAGGDGRPEPEHRPEPIAQDAVDVPREAMFLVGDRVLLPHGSPGIGWSPVGTVVGFDTGDVIVLWDTGLQVPLAPWNLRHAAETDNSAR